MGKNLYNVRPSVNSYYQIGGGKCSLCHSEGTNKSTCPLNPAAHGGNPVKHPLAILQRSIEPRLKGNNGTSTKTIPKSPVVLQQESLSQTNEAQQLKQLPVAETIILNMYNMDEVNAFCSGNKEIQKTCKKLFDKDAIEQEIKAEKLNVELPMNKKDTPVVSHIKALMKITNPSGLVLLEELHTTLTSISMDDAYRYTEDDEQKYYTKQELDVPLAFKKTIKVTMLNSNLHWLSDLDDITYDRVINASNGRYVSVGDVVEAFFENNREIYKRAQEETGEEEPSLGNYIYFQGLSEKRPGQYDMTSFGS